MTARWWIFCEAPVGLHISAHFFRLLFICLSMLCATGFTTACEVPDDEEDGGTAEEGNGDGGIDNMQACLEYIEAVKAVYAKCDIDSTIEPSFCMPIKTSMQIASRTFACLTNGYTCEADGTVLVDTSDCAGCT